MLDMPIIEVAIGLVFAYVLLSMLCTLINEWVARFFSLRSRNLNKGLRQLLADPGMTGLAKNVLNHHLIKGSATKQSVFKQSYIASETFARVLIEVIDKKSKGAVKVAKTTNGLKNSINKVKIPKEVKEAITGLIDNANTTIDDLRENLQAWFDGSMERISGWYKRRVHVISFFIALSLAVGFNADTILIGKSLWQNPILRSQIADEAAMAVEACRNKSPEECSFLNETKAARDKLETFPIGWKISNLHFPDDWKWYLFKIIGLFITTLAVSLGAPFWFDVLDKLNSIRSSGIKPKAVMAK